MITCPFCQDPDFDLPGLKAHLLRGHCEAFSSTEAPTRFVFDSSERDTMDWDAALGVAR